MRAIQSNAIVNANFAQNVWQLVKNNGGELISVTIDNPDGGSGLLGKYGIIKEADFLFSSCNSELSLTVRFCPNFSNASLVTDIKFRDYKYAFERSIRIDGNGVRELSKYINEVVSEWRSKAFRKDEE